MNKVIKRNRIKKFKFITVISNHIYNNKKEYLIACILFAIGLIFGIMYANNIDENKFNQISEYIRLLINNLNKVEEINYIELLKKSVISNTIVIVIMWIAASTIIGIPIVYAEVAFRGFVLGYTVSCVLMVLGIKDGTIYNIGTLLLHNIIFVPVLLGTAVSGMKTYKSIMKNKQKDNIKLEFLRHTIFCLLMLILLIISSIVEVYISTNLSKLLAQFIKI